MTNPKPLLPGWDAQAIDRLVQDEVLRLRVQNVLAAKPEESRGKRLLAHPLSNTILQFVLTAFFGGLIAYVLQGSAERHKRAAELREVRRSGAEKVFRDVSTLMDRRLYWNHRYQQALATADQSSIGASRARLDSMAIEWNTSLNTNVAMLCIYYDPAVARYFFAQISPTMDWYTDLLLSQGTHPAPAADLDVIHSHLQQAVYALDLQLADRIRSGNLWSDRETSQCRIPTEFSQLLPRPEK
jgi:hypothetical protein